MTTSIHQVICQEGGWCRGERLPGVEECRRVGARRACHGESQRVRWPRREERGEGRGAALEVDREERMERGGRIDRRTGPRGRGGGGGSGVRPAGWKEGCTSGGDREAEGRRGRLIG